MSHLLLPSCNLPIHKNPFGIYGNAALCLVYLSECFMKIDKPQVALKCFTLGIQEMQKVQVTQELINSDEIQTILSVLDFEGFKPDEIIVSEDPSVPA